MSLPSSTYRIQLSEKFTLRDLAGIIDYLYQLGIDTIYASPITTAFKGSSHGYDVTNPLILSPEIGTEEELQQIAATLKRYGMRWLQDIVPNHMAYDSNNTWLNDVLERGKESSYWGFFDIVDRPVELLGEKLMAPFLGSTLTECLQKGELALGFNEKGFVLQYYDKEYPVAPACYGWICTVAEGYPEGLVSRVEQLAAAAKGSAVEWTAAKSAWLEQVSKEEGFRSFIAARVSFINERPTLLETLFQEQHYQLTAAHLASSVINYRRFFTVNSLICLRMEKEDVFSAYHERIHRWYEQGWIQGLRIDHIDGLADPKGYIKRLRELFGAGCYIVAEKILTGDEVLPGDWAIEGTTGYDFLSMAGQLLTDITGSQLLLDYYQQQVITLPHYPEVVFERKYNFLRNYMAGELDNLFFILEEEAHFAMEHNKTRFKEALATLMASFPVYRAYPDEGTLAESDWLIINAAIQRAKHFRPDSRPELSGIETFLRQPSSFRSRLMQFTGPLAAKGIEDTTFYVYNPYIALNEVGDSPGKAGLSTEAFHEKMAFRRGHAPHTMNGTSTHDTKRGEDSRIRLSGLSADPEAWITAVTRWRELNKRLVTEVGGRPAPSANDEYLIYQALLGAFPEDGVITDVFRDRFAGYLTKALREAKAETSYDHPDEAYEGQCQQFAKGLLSENGAFFPDFRAFAMEVISRSAVYSLSLLLIKLTAPGIPDIYQGAELWETSLVDPDNRRPIDFELRNGLLQQIKLEAAKGPGAVLDFVRTRRGIGAEKLFTSYRALQFRKQHRRLFAEGEYIPVSVEGPLLAFIRRVDTEWALVIVPLIRYQADLPQDISLELPEGAPEVWTHVFTEDNITVLPGRRLVLKELWNKWPVALLSGNSR